MAFKDGMGVAAAAIAVALAGIAWVLEPSPPRDDAQATLLRASLIALETHAPGQPLIWRNRASGHEAIITPASAFRDPSGRWCRPYSIEYSAGDFSRHIACRHGDGLWDRPPGQQLAGH